MNYKLMAVLVSVAIAVVIPAVNRDFISQKDTQVVSPSQETGTSSQPNSKTSAVVDVVTSNASSSTASAATVVAPLTQEQSQAATVATATANSLASVGKPGGIAINGLTGMTEQALRERFTDIRSMGFTWVRMDYQWPNVQPRNQNEYDWRNYDLITRVAHESGLKILGILDYTPVWARPVGCTGGDKCPPRDAGEFEKYAGITAKRYAGKVQAWEIWNESNSHHFWKPTPKISDYARLLKHAYTAIKKADPGAIVVTGASDSSDIASNKVDAVTALRELYANGAKGYFDVVGYHPYSFPSLPTDTSSNWAKQNRLRNVLIENGEPSKQLWATEYGAPTNGPIGSFAINESQQAALAQSAFNAFWAKPATGAFFWYTYKDAGTNTSSKENFFGLLRADGSKKPAYDTIKNQLLQR